MKQVISNYFRSRRDNLLRGTIAQSSRRGEYLEILDVGGRVDYWRRVGFMFLQSQRVRITLLNMTEAEIGDIDGVPDFFKFAIGDARALDYADNAFDLCHSNSVIEHVGLWRDMQAFAKEVRRVAPSYYCQTPNYWFPIDPHFAGVPFNHWMPRPIRASLMRALPLAHSGRATDLSEAFDYVDGARLLTGAQMSYLFPGGILHAERVLLLPKSYTAVRLG